MLKRTLISQNKLITRTEADVLIMNENSDIIDDKIDYPGTVNGRCVRVAHMYLFGRDHIRRALDIAGLQKLNVSSINELRLRDYLFGLNGYFIPDMG